MKSPLKVVVNNQKKKKTGKIKPDPALVKAYKEHLIKNFPYVNR